MSNLKKYEDDVEAIDKIMGIQSTNDCTTSNLMFFTLCMVGEAGELANVVKKMVRNGATKERWKDFEEELADVLIYFVKLIKLSGIDFDKAWDDKHNVLKMERAGRLKNYKVEDIKLERR